MVEEEIFPLVNEEGDVIGQASRSVCHNGSKLLHPVVHLHIFNLTGELLLQKRSARKDIQPNLWDSSVAGHIDLNETPLDAVLRETKEELSLVDIQPHYITKYIIETDKERELSYCFYAIYDKEIGLFNETEIQEVRFWNISDIEVQLSGDTFTFNFREDFKTYLKGLYLKEKEHFLLKI